MGKTIGIDLGTTNSAMAVLTGGEPEVIPNAEGGRTTPSVVAFTPSGERLVGAVARRQAVTNPQNTVFSVKRFMGRDTNEVSEEQTIVPYEVVPGPSGDVRVKAGDKEWSPQEIAVFGLQPGMVDTDMQVRIRQSGINDVSRVPRSQLGNAARAARLIAWIARERPVDLHGQDLSIRDGLLVERSGIDR